MAYSHDLKQRVLEYVGAEGGKSEVGIKNIGNVERHDINTVFGSRSHVVRFVNGGVLQFAYNAKNELIELTASKLTMHLSKSGAAIFDVFEDYEGA